MIGCFGMDKELILITGGAGFIGSHVNLLLQEQNLDTLILDNLSTGLRSSVLKGQLIVGDLRDGALLDELFAHHPVSAVMHFAALTDVGESVLNPSVYYKNNVAASLTLFDSMQKAGVKRLIFSSSAAVYGLPTADSVTEDSALKPINPYGETKRIVEKILQEYQNAYGWQCCALRYFNAAGADPQGRLKHLQKSHLIPRILDCLKHDRELTIFGTDYPTPDGTAIRDYIHVADLAKAHLLALKKLYNGNGAPCYNLGNGKGYSVLEVIHAAEEVTRKPLQVHRGARRAGDPPWLVAKAEKARRELGWFPQHNLHKMIEDAWKTY